MDKAGPVVLPKLVRDALALESSHDSVLLRPAQGNGRTRKKQGGWVFGSGKPLAADVVRKTIVRMRDERDRRSLGKFR